MANEIEIDIALAGIETVKKDIDKVKKSLKGIESTKGTDDQAKSIGKLSTATTSLTKSLGSLALAYASVQSAMAFVALMADLEQGFIGVQKTTGMTTEEMSKFKDELYDLSTTLKGIKFQELQKIAEGAGQLGVAKEDVIAFTESIAKISVATGLTAESASADLQKIANVFGIPVKDVEKLGSAINELSASTTATVPTIVDSLKRMAGSGKAFGLTADELMAFSATMSDIGANTEVGATAFMQILNKMQTDTAKFADIAGKDITEFADIMKNEPTKAIRMFLEGFNGIDNKAVALNDLKLGGAGTSQVILGLAENTDKLTKSLETSNKAYADGTSIQKEYDLVSQGLSAKSADLSNAFIKMSRSLMVELAPALKDLADGLIEMMNGMDGKAIAEFAESMIGGAKAVGGFVAENQALITTLLELSVAFMGLKKVYGVLEGIIGVQSIANMASFNTSMVAMGASAKAFGRTLMTLVMANPVLVALGVAVTGVVVALDMLEESNASMEESIKKVNQATASSSTIFQQYQKDIQTNGQMYFDTVEAQRAYLVSISEVINKNKEQIAIWKSQDAELYAQQIANLSQQNEVLEATAIRVSQTTQQNIEDMVASRKATEALANAQKTLTLEHQNSINSSIAGFQQRSTALATELQKMGTAETKLNADLMKLEADLAGVRLKYANQREALTMSSNSRILALTLQSVDADKKANLQKIEAEKMLGKAKEAISKGNLEMGKQYLGEYNSLIDSSAQAEIASAEETGASKSSILSKYQADVEASKALELAMINELEAKEIASANAKIDAKKLEIEMNKAQMEMTKQMITLLGELVKQGQGARFEMDFTSFDKATKDAENQLKSLEDEKRTVKIDADTAQAQKELSEITKDTSSTHTVYIETKGAMPDGSSSSSASPFFRGGMVTDGVRSRDSVLGYLAKGEYIVKNSVTDKWGQGFFDKLNSGRITPDNISKMLGASRFFDGGRVAGTSKKTSTNIVNLTIGGNEYRAEMEKSTLDKLAKDLRRNI